MNVVSSFVGTCHVPTYSHALELKSTTSMEVATKETKHVIHPSIHPSCHTLVLKATTRKLAHVIHPFIHPSRHPLVLKANTRKLAHGHSNILLSG
jgi:hypothetical protein